MRKKAQKHRFQASALPQKKNFQLARNLLHGIQYYNKQHPRGLSSEIFTLRLPSTPINRIVPFSWC